MQMEAICRRKLDTWAAVGCAVDLAAEGRELSFDFSTELLVRCLACCSRFMHLNHAGTDGCGGADG